MPSMIIRVLRGDVHQGRIYDEYVIVQERNVCCFDVTGMNPQSPHLSRL